MNESRSDATADAVGAGDDRRGPLDQAPASAPADPGLNSIADLKALTRLLFYGLVAAVIIGAVVAALAHEWLALVILVAAYLVIAIVQWVAVSHRLQGKRDPK